MWGDTTRCFIIIIITIVNNILGRWFPLSRAGAYLSILSENSGLEILSIQCVWFNDFIVWRHKTKTPIQKSFYKPKPDDMNIYLMNNTTQHMIEYLNDSGGMWRRRTGVCKYNEKLLQYVILTYK